MLLQSDEHTCESDDLDLTPDFDDFKIRRNISQQDGPKQVRFNSAVAISSMERNYLDLCDLSASSLTSIDSASDIPNNSLEYEPRDTLEHKKSLSPTASDVHPVEMPRRTLDQTSQLDDHEDESLDLSLQEVVNKIGNPSSESHECLSKPSYNSIKQLQFELQQLTENLSRSHLGPTKEDYARAVCELDPLYAKKHSKDAFDKETPSSFPDASIPTHVNFGTDEILFRDLINQSMSESDIIRVEREKIAKQRRTIQSNLRLTKTLETLPEPDILKYFDPTKHIYQAVDLNINPEEEQNLVPVIQPTWGLSMLDRLKFASCS